MTSHSRHTSHSSEKHHETDPLRLSHPKEIPATPIEDTQTYNQKYIVVAVVITIIIIGVLFLMKSRKAPAYDSTSSVDTIQISPTPTPTVVPDQTIATGDISKTVTWLHYTSPTNDYTFQYPKDNFVQIDRESPKINFCNIGKADVSLGIYFPLYQKPIFETEFAGNLLLTVGSVDNTDNLSIDAWVQEHCANAWFMKENPDITTNSVNINNFTGRIYTTQSGKAKDTGKLIIIPHNRRFYFIYGRPYENTFYNLIISTFKFLK